MTEERFQWVVDATRTWPPPTRPRPPFGPTALEVMRSCPLRLCFEASGGYQRRSGYAARVGTAFHATLEKLSTDPPSGAPDEVAEAARGLFAEFLARQETEAVNRPREATLPREEDRVQRAIEAVMVEAQRLARAGGEQLSDTAEGARTTARELDESAEVEIPVRSADGLFHGRIDRAERTPSGVRLVDYKSALRPDLPERYERQLQLYAYLWHEEYGEWPVEGAVVYPLVSTAHRVTVDPDTCREVALDSALQIDGMHAPNDLAELARPGDVCKVCEFRPWCRPFWQRQSTEGAERAGVGIEGEVRQIRRQDTHWLVEIDWRGNTVVLAAEDARFPHLQEASVGTRVRILDVRLHGQRHRPRAQTNDYTEIFLVQQEQPGVAGAGGLPARV